MKKVKIPRTLFPEFTGDIDVNFDDDQFDLVPEHFPAGLTEKTYKGKAVRWVSNFTLKKKPNAEKKGLKVKYTIELEKQTGELVYFNGKDVLLLPYRDLEGNRVEADLEADDPAAGWAD
jgi:hypothetical protein